MQNASPRARRSSRQLLWLGGGIVSALGCNYPDPARDAAAACAIYALSTCQALERCGSASLAAFGSLETCQIQLSVECEHGLRQPDVLSTSRAVRVCADAMSAVCCTGLYNRELPPSCAVPRGKRSEGAACSVAAQCAGGRCVRLQATDAWGQCRELAAPGQSCSSFADCHEGAVCNAAGRCVMLAALGEPCSELAPCRSPLACNAGRCEAAPALGACGALGCEQEPLAAASACQLFAQTLCERLGVCAPALVTRVYGDSIGCVSRNNLGCLTRQRTPDVISSAAGLSACTQQLSSLECGALLDNALPAVCQLAPGARANGRACSDDAQCASTRCARARCRVRRVSGARRRRAAVSSWQRLCAGLVCTSDLLCRRPAGLDASCDARHPCAFPLTCAALRCSAPLALGSACEPASDRCDRYAGLACDTQSARCRSWLQAPPGQACGYTGAGWAECSASGSCRTAPGASAGLCEGPLPDGASCVEGTTSGCLTPARCVAGMCRLPAPEDCAS